MSGGAAVCRFAHRWPWLPLQGTTYSQAQLLAASPIQSDLGALASAGAGENLTVPVFVNDTSGGVRLADCRQDPVARYQQLQAW
jgi:hypothetical protein